MIYISRNKREVCRIGLDGIYIRRGRWWVNLLTGREIPVLEGEGGIWVRNLGELFLPILNVSASVPPHAPTGAAVIARTVVPSDGRIVALQATIAVAGTAGNSTDHKQQLRVRNAGFDGSGSTVLTGNVVLKDLNLTPDDLPVEGVTRQAFGLASGANVRKGQILEVHHDESGTLGTGTRATFNLGGVIYRTTSSPDFTLSG